MADVAAEVGVAVVTVSRALNSPDLVAPKTLEAVRQAVRRLGYVPDLAACSLASMRSRIVGAIVPTLGNAWFSETMEGLAAALAPAGYHLMLAQSAYHPDAVSGWIDTFVGRRVDALVLTGAVENARLAKRLRKMGIPVVETWDLPRRPIDIAVGFSNEEAGRLAARHLVVRGRRGLAYLGTQDRSSIERLKGFSGELRAIGMAEPVVRIEKPEPSIEMGTRMADALLKEVGPFDGVFFSNDLLAVGALSRWRSHGLAVPKDIAIVGFSDVAVAKATSPSLTTIRVDAREMGRIAGERLLERLCGATAPDRRVDVGVRLVQRASS